MSFPSELIIDCKDCGRRHAKGSHCYNVIQSERTYTAAEVAELQAKEAEALSHVLSANERLRTENAELKAQCAAMLDAAIAIAEKVARNADRPDDIGEEIRALIPAAQPRDLGRLRGYVNELRLRGQRYETPLDKEAGEIGKRLAAILKEME